MRAGDETPRISDRIGVLSRECCGQGSVVSGCLDADIGDSTNAILAQYVHCLSIVDRACVDVVACDLRAVDGAVVDSRHVDVVISKKRSVDVAAIVLGSVDVEAAVMGVVFSVVPHKKTKQTPVAIHKDLELGIHGCHIGDWGRARPQ
ncbi:hypothetical protein Bca101_016575 [Brassica carinata]